MVSRRERRLWLVSVASLPLLLAGNYAVDAWRNAKEYVRRNELQVHSSISGQAYAGALWSISQTRLIGDGRDTKITFPGQMRLLILQMTAQAEEEIGSSWSECQLTLTDPSGRRWLPLNFLLSDSISRDLDPQATLADGCDAASRKPPAKGAGTLIEEKFVVPADVIPLLSVRLSFASTRPNAISFPLRPH
ncbi:hypothetical protein [Rhizobium sp. BR 314]|uniref:hypothetical protein n=1 Tax=Rhizobium sp. BR 314 TaxID=3040013 RepID=UPI0039BF9B66